MGNPKKTKAFFSIVKLRDGSKSVHEPLMLFDVLISQLRTQVNMKQTRKGEWRPSEEMIAILG